LKAIISGKTGFMTDFDPCNMAKEMLKISELNPEKRLKMSERCREHAKAFSVEVMAAKTRELYMELRIKYAKR
ncbi:MAG: hypothetical protein PHX43_09475, partial [Alphaproteobacteria bacterium]|nr:hypothetical protein [Alphaproteobacteria bacterium]